MIFLPIRFGGTEGATFCTLTTICNQLDSEAHLDIYLYAKLYHDHRPSIWPTFVSTSDQPSHHIQVQLII